MAAIPSVKHYHVMGVTGVGHIPMRASLPPAWHSTGEMITGHALAPCTNSSMISPNQGRNVNRPCGACHAQGERTPREALGRVLCCPSPQMVPPTPRPLPTLFQLGPDIRKPCPRAPVNSLPLSKCSYLTLNRASKQLPFRVQPVLKARPSCRPRSS